jgi:hypothetical protein
MFRHSLWMMLILLAAIPAVAQDPNEAAARQAEAARQAYERQRAETEGRRIADERAKEVQAQRDREAKDPVTAAKLREAERQRQQFLREEALKNLRVTIQGFQSARQELTEALVFKSKLKPSARRLEKTTQVFLAFLKNRSKERGRFDSKEFKGLSNSELGWEALTTAEKITPVLANMIATEEAETVNIGYVSTLPALERELLRLQWMTRQLK